jgi:hypothetical protein
LGNSLFSIDRYYSCRGYKKNPVLELKDNNQVASYAKTLPGGGRVHVRVNKGRLYYNVSTHVDSVDPDRDLVGHLRDFIVPNEHVLRRVRRLDIRTI